MALPVCLYLHGFLSSPHSLKAQQVHDWYEQHHCPHRLSIPALPFAPEQAMAVAEAELQRLLEEHPNTPVLIIGSSLGGYYATWLAEHYPCSAALINPAVRPFDLFANYLGPNTHFHTGEVHHLETEHIDQLRRFYCPQLQYPQRCLLLLQTGDETLDYRQAAHYYRNSPAWLEGGGDHSFVNFVQRLPMLMQFSQR